jgi:hypothetical protein
MTKEQRIIEEEVQGIETALEVLYTNMQEHLSEKSIKLFESVEKRLNNIKRVNEVTN